MKTKTFTVLIVLLGMFVTCAQAKPIEPVPITVVKYKGEDIPVFDAKDIHPRTVENPQYPADAADLHVEGHAIIVMVVDADGKVIEADIKESKPTPSFGVAAQAAVKKWRYPAFAWKGQPTKFIIQQVVMFDMR